MAIALACPACKRALKVKDELAGRRIKCPGCATVLPVPGKKAATEESVTAKKPRPVPTAAEDDDEPDEDERPRKKKKKKQAASNRGLLIGAGVAVVVAIAAIVLIVVTRGGASKEVAQRRPEPTKHIEAKKTEQPVVQVSEPETKKKPPITGIGRVKERVVIENSLRQLGIAYRNFEVEQNRGPKDQKELGPYYQNVNDINEALKNKDITFIWGVPRRALTENGDSNTVLAYETDADRQGMRMVLFGDGHVDGLNEEDFKKAPKAKGR